MKDKHILDESESKHPIRLDYQLVDLANFKKGSIFMALSGVLLLGIAILWISLPGNVYNEFWNLKEGLDESWDDLGAWVIILGIFYSLAYLLLYIFSLVLFIASLGLPFLLGGLALLIYFVAQPLLTSNTSNELETVENFWEKQDNFWSILQFFCIALLVFIFFLIIAGNS